MDEITGRFILKISPKEIEKKVIRYFIFEKIFGIIFLFFGILCISSLIINPNIIISFLFICGILILIGGYYWIVSAFIYLPELYENGIVLCKSSSNLFGKDKKEFIPFKDIIRLVTFHHGNTKVIELRLFLKNGKKIKLGVDSEENHKIIHESFNNFKHKLSLHNVD